MQLAVTGEGGYSTYDTAGVHVLVDVAGEEVFELLHVGQIDFYGFL